MAAGTALGGLTLALAFAAAFTVYVLVAIPLVAPAAFFFALHHRQRRARPSATTIRFPLERAEPGPRPSPVPGRTA
jgi:hypothetical protein